MDEEWKDIPDYEGKYQVSNLGRVRSIKAKRYVHGKIVDVYREHIMSLTDNGNGYLIFGAMSNTENKRVNIYVHRAVALAFLEKEDGKDEVNHKDFNKHNNCVDNLEWCTSKENTQYSLEHYAYPRNTALPRTGEKYIHFKRGRYRVCIRPLKFDRSFQTMEEAIQKRNEILEGTKWEV